MGLFSFLTGYNSDDCPHCNGHGRNLGADEDGSKCSSCDGTGNKSDYNSNFTENNEGDRVCSMCGGSGYMGWDTDCPQCR